MKKLLVVVDMQKDFIDGALGTLEAQQIVPAVRKRICEYREAGDEVVFTLDTHGSDYMDTMEGEKASCSPLSEGEQKAGSWMQASGSLTESALRKLPLEAPNWQSMQQQADMKELSSWTVYRYLCDLKCPADQGKDARGGNLRKGGLLCRRNSTKPRKML